MMQEIEIEKCGQCDQRHQQGMPTNWTNQTNKK